MNINLPRLSHYQSLAGGMQISMFAETYAFNEKKMADVVASAIPAAKSARNISTLLKNSLQS